MLPRAMKYTAAVLALSLPLMGATSCQDKLRSGLTTTCAALDVVYAHYDAVAPTGAIPVKYMNDVDLARKQTDRVCASPGTATTASVTAAAAMAYVALRNAFKASKSAGAAKVGYSELTDLKRLVEQAKK